MEWTRALIELAFAWLDGQTLWHVQHCPRHQAMVSDILREQGAEEPGHVWAGHAMWN